MDVLTPIFISIIAGVVSTLTPIGVFVFNIVEKRLEKNLGLQNKTLTYTERINMLTKNLENASQEVDHILQEMAKVTQERQKVVEELEQQQQELQKKIDTLKDVPLPAAEIFTQYLQKSERVGEKRDYRIFFYGVIATVVITIIITVVLHLFGI